MKDYNRWTFKRSLNIEYSLIHFIQVSREFQNLGHSDKKHLEHAQNEHKCAVILRCYKFCLWSDTSWKHEIFSHSLSIQQFNSNVSQGLHWKAFTKFARIFIEFKGRKILRTIELTCMNLWYVSLELFSYKVTFRKIRVSAMIAKLMIDVLQEMGSKFCPKIHYIYI